MIVRYGFGPLAAAVSKLNSMPTPKQEIGKVFGVVTTENTPTKEAFDKVGGYNGVGAVFYIDYENSKSITGSIDLISRCKIAYPKDPQSQYYPVRGELILITPGPGRSNSNTAANDFYTLFNVWNNPQQNAKLADSNDTLGLTFTENPNVRSLLPYEGDNILGGRQGSSLRFTTTTKGVNPANEWSNIGGEYDPLVILANGLKYDPSKKFYIEQINKDDSSIYLTSTQSIPLVTDKSSNKIGTLSNYSSAQIILNSDRVVLNSKKDEVLIFAKTDIELNTKNMITLNADSKIYLNSNKVYLGSKSTPYQPILLGSNTELFFIELLDTLVTLSEYLSCTTGVAPGSTMPNFSGAGKELNESVRSLLEKIKRKYLVSRRVYTQ